MRADRRPRFGKWMRFRGPEIDSPINVKNGIYGLKPRLWGGGNRRKKKRNGTANERDMNAKAERGKRPSSGS